MNIPITLKRRTCLLPRLAWCLLSITGCDSTLDPTEVERAEPVATSLVLSAATEMALKVPATLNVGASVRDQYGDVMSGQIIEYLSRDTTTASVDAAGTVSAVAAGETVVLVSCGTLSDSVTVRARYHVLPGEARARIRGGGVDYERSWDPEGFFADYISSDERDYSILRFLNTAYADTGLVVWFRGGPEPGEYPLQPVTAMDLFETEMATELTMPSAYFLVEVDDDLFVYTAIEGDLIIESVTSPPGLGDDGQVMGSLSLVAVGHELLWDSDWNVRPVETGDTMTVYADFSGAYTHVPRGEATITLTGTHTLDAELAEAYFVDYGQQGYLEAYSSGADVTLAMAQPEAGQFPLNGMSGGSRITPFVYVYVDNEYGLGTGGTLSIDEARPATESRYGEMKGSVHADLAYYEQYLSGPVAGTGTLTLHFHVPLDPTGAWAAASRLQQSDVPLWRWLASGDAFFPGPGPERR